MARDKSHRRERNLAVSYVNVETCIKKLHFVGSAFTFDRINTEVAEPAMGHALTSGYPVIRELARISLLFGP